MRSLIAWVYQNFLKKILFKRDPEDVHDSFIKIGNILGKFAITRFFTRLFFRYRNPMLEQEVAGITFKNPVGLSEGFDKDANLIDILPEVGFGFNQIGSITWFSYAGNAKPRLIRLPNSRGIIVNYGLKNIGAKKISENLEKHGKTNIPLSISIAKTNSPETCTIDQGIEDYFNSYKLLNEKNLGDFYTLNISCPNTFGGEPFTTPEKLDALLKKIREIKSARPLFIKMPINLSWNRIAQLLKVAVRYEVTGVIIGNLNKDRSNISSKDKVTEEMKGGISGKPTWKLGNKLIEKTYKQFGKKLIIIGVGGIFSAEDAYEKIKLGATLVQLITGMIFEGPQLIGQINKGLVKLLKQDGYKNISEAIGVKAGK
ncbi:MAG: quinone-dependent dihydroorotate dehydrogenase [bacterium]